MRQFKIDKNITKRDHIINAYLQEIGRYDLISQEEEVLLAKKIREGDKKALEKLVKANLRFVVSVSKNYQNKGLSLPELINEGNRGLIKAAKKFDETRGFKFISHAVWWIRQSILRAIAEERSIRIPLNRQSEIRKIKKTRIALEQIHEGLVPDEEIAERTGIDIETLREIERCQEKIFSLDSPIGFLNDLEEITLLGTIPNTESSPDQSLIDESLKKELIQVLNKILPENERKVLTMYYGLSFKKEHTIDQIAEILGLNRERIRQLKESGIKRIRRNVSSRKILKQYI